MRLIPILLLFLAALALPAGAQTAPEAPDVPVVPVSQPSAPAAAPLADPPAAPAGQATPAPDAPSGAPTPPAPAGAPASPAPAAPATATPPAAPPPELQRLIEVLRNDDGRAALLRALEAASGPAAAPGAPAAEPPPAPAVVPDLLPPNTLGGQLITGAQQRLQAMTESALRAAQALTDLPGLITWASGVMRDPVTQYRIMDASWKLALLFLAGLAAEWLAGRALRRWSDRLDALAPEPGSVWGWMKRVPLVLGRFLLDLVPIAAFAIVSYGMIGAVQPLPTTELVLLTANNAYMALRAVMAGSRMLFSPASALLRLVPLQDETAAYVTIWIRRIAVVAILGFAVAEAGLLFGLPWTAYDAILRFDLLVATLLLVIVILQNRGPVADWLRAPPLAESETPDRMRRLFRTLRDRLADVWHLLAILWLLALWGVWALEVRDGFERLIRVSAFTIVIAGLAKLADFAARRAIARGFRIGPDLARRFPGLEARANRYLPVLRGLVSAFITVIALLLLLEAWGVDAFTWFSRGQLGARLLGSLVSVGLTVLVAVTLWELSNAAIQRHLAKLSRDAQAARSARVRTLLPMLRTLLSITIIAVVALNVLTEIGINVAPLIAGAGVVGLAIGFGSQTLVRDVITGAFLLFEDAMAVGDVVQVGGLSGVVEQLSIRSIKLRAMDGSVHIIPFSAVTTVTNMTRDFGFAVLDISVGYGEETDRVTEVLREVAAGIRQDPKFGPQIRDDIEIMGVERLANSGVLIRSRIKTDPASRWAVGREFNRRIKQRFDKLGIEIPYPHQKLVIEREARHPAEDFPDQPAPAKRDA